jgi:high-affinity Fe2+/Pb2+ permease
MIAFMVTTIVAILVQLLFLTRWLGEDHTRRWFVIGGFVLVFAVLAPLVTWWLDRHVSKRASGLDESSALSLVLGLVATESARSAKNSAAMHAMLKRDLCRLLRAQAQDG